ncbi:PsiF family protein [Sulfuricystis thermophila]|uniref:PsiF family protein n=1 Tax=Sulfuricystis thermophila TaxID=2496847 RepID=UPI0010358B8D|nr:PsiF family protein [Sulfuricystis thermophila]
MKKLLAAATLVIASQFALSPAFAVTPQQQRMADCNAEAKAKNLAGDERKAFMKQCLSAKKDGRAAQQEKMKTCNAEATKKALKGDARKAFMKECLSN